MSQLHPLQRALSHPILDPSVGCRRWFGPLKPCRAPGGGAATLASVALHFDTKEWPRYCRKVYWTKMVQNGQIDHFGQNDLIPIRNFRTGFWHSQDQNGPFWSILVYSGPFRSANRTLATPELHTNMRSRMFSASSEPTRIGIPTGTTKDFRQERISKGRCMIVRT